MALVVKTEASGRAGCGAFACRAGNIPLDCRPGALGACVDEAERQMGVEQVVQTINRIKYLWEKEDDIKKEL